MKKIKIVKHLITIILIIIITFSLCFKEENKNKNGKRVLILKRITEMDSNEITIVNQAGNQKIVDDNYLFVGDSITYRYDLNNYFKGLPTVNSGEEGNKTKDIINNIKERIYDYNPSKIFLLIGANQLEENTTEEIFEDIKKIITLIRENRKYAYLFVESIYPVNSDINGPSKNKSNTKIMEINNELRNYYENIEKVQYIDIYSHLIDENGNLDIKYTEDGLHLNDNGYQEVTNVLKKYI